MLYARVFCVLLPVIAANAVSRAADFGITRPGPADKPTRVAFAIAIVDVSSIESAQQTFTADVGLALSWHDPRLAKPGSGGRVMNLGDVWNPDVHLLNQRSVTALMPEIVDVSDDGTVVYRQRYSGQFSNRIHVGDFPFDEHDFHVRFAAAQYVTGEVEFTNEPMRDRTGITENPLVVDWKITSWKVNTDPFASKMMALSRPAFALQFHAHRRAGFFVMKLLLPLGLVVFMSWVVFWLDPERVDAQVGMAATAVLTLIAYRFTFDSLLPPVSYLTRVDHFITGSTALVFLSLLEVIITGTLVHKNRIADARRVDQWSRVIFPSLFLAIILWSFVA